MFFSKRKNYHVSVYHNLVPRVSFSASIVVEKETLVQAGHVPPKILEVNQICVRKGKQYKRCYHCDRGNQHAFDFVIRRASTNRFTAGYCMFYTWKFDVKSKRLLSNRSDATENTLESFEFSLLSAV